MPTKAQLESALRNADKAGDAQAAKMLANAIKSGQYSDMQEISPQQASGEVPVMPNQESQLPEIYAPQPKPERSLGEKVMGGLEAAAATTIGSVPAMVGQAVGAAQGLTEYLGKGDFSTPPGELVQQRAMEGAQRLTPVPPSEAGREYTQAVGETLAPLAAFVPLAADMAGAANLAKIYNATKKMSRAPAAVEYLNQANEAPKTAPELVPIEQQGRNTEFLNKVNAPIKESAKKADIRQAIVSGDKAGAGFKIDKKGIVVPDPAAKTAMSNGMSDKAVATINFSSPEDKAQFNQILNYAERAMKNAPEGARNPPSIPIGNSMMKRFKFVYEQNRKASKDIGAAANTELKGKVVDISDTIDTFSNDLADLGVTINQEGKLDFTGSLIEGSNTKPIERVWNRLKSQDDGFKLHQDKRFISKQIDYDTAAIAKEPIDKQAEAALSRLRQGINDKLIEQSPAYKEANQRFATTIDAMNSFADVAGSKFDPEKPYIDKIVGQELRKTLSNYGVGPDMVAAVDKLDEVANQFGGAFKDDVIHQTVFYSELERMFGSFKPNSLQGVQEKAIERAGGRLMSGDVKGAAVEGIKGQIMKRFGPTEEKQIKAIRELINRQ